MSSSEKILFVTGRLAETSLRSVVQSLSEQLHFDFEVAVPGIQVAALLHTGLLIKRLNIPDDVDRVVLPGWFQGDLAEVERHFRIPFARGPKNLHDLPEYFGLGSRPGVILDDYNIEIVAEINHATRLPLDDVVAKGVSMSADGADVIDVGCVPGESSARVRDIVTALRDHGLRVSVDSFDQTEVEQAVQAGAELILSANRSNIDWVGKLGAEVVAIPDAPNDLDSLDVTVNALLRQDATFRLDPIIEPIGMGFTSSLGRYMDTRVRYPDLPMMMGTGNVTELTEVDSAGVNMVLAAVCEELQIHSVLTTQVINWCRSCVAELDTARRLLKYSVENQVLPKHLDPSLVMLRDAKRRVESPEALAALAEALTDSNYRIFVGRDGLHLMNRDGHWQGEDVFAVFSQALQTVHDRIDAGHAFYLGYELARAELANKLGKNYVQDEPVTWGCLGDWNASSAVHQHRPTDETQEE